MVKYDSVYETRAYWYAWNVVEGKIIAGKDIINACTRFISDLEKSQKEQYPYYFDINVMAKIENIASCFKFSSGGKSGQTVELAPPQSFILGNIYCWRFKSNSEKRRIRSAFIMIARKNAKSFIIALISLIAMVEEQENETYSFAGKKEQARICFEQCKALIRTNPKVARKFKLNKLEIILKSNNSKFQPLASEEKTLDGTSPSTGIIDEAFIVPAGVKHSVSTGTGARLSPLVVSISTSYDVQMIGNWAYNDMNLTKNVNAGIIENDRHFGVIYSLDHEKEVSDFDMWEKANPLMPYSETLKEDLRENYNLAKNDASELRNFKIKRMNLILEGLGIEKYLKLDKWKSLEQQRINFLNKHCFFGIDLSITTDLTAVAKCFYDVDSDMFNIEVHGFIPESRAIDLEIADSMPYRQYAKEGYLSLCPGEVINQDFIIEWILKNQRKDLISMVGYDPYNSDYMIKRFEELGVNTFEVRQGYRMLSGPTKLFRQYVYEGKINYVKNPLLDWCVSNAITTKDKFNNELLDKVKSTQKIDLLAASIFAFLMCDNNKWTYTDRQYDRSFMI